MNTPIRWTPLKLAGLIGISAVALLFPYPIAPDGLIRSLPLNGSGSVINAPFRSRAGSRIHTTAGNRADPAGRRSRRSIPVREEAVLDRVFHRPGRFKGSRS